MGTTNNALRDFRSRSGPFVARVRSHADATAKAIRPRHGKEAAIPPLRWEQKSLYINMLSAGGEGGIRTLGSSGFVIIGIRWCLEVLIS